MNRLPTHKPTPTVVVLASGSSPLTMLQHWFPRRPLSPSSPPPTTTTVVTSPETVDGFECLNRNARRGKKANHGKRAVSSARRKEKRRTLWKKNG